MPAPLRPLSLRLSDVCFIHWPVSTAAIRACIPDWTEPDTSDGTAWVTAVAVTIDRFETFGVPVRENVEAVILRTYVRTPSDQRAVHFLSLDVTDRIAADAAQALFRFPAHHADVERRRRDDGTEVRARRRSAAAPGLHAEFQPLGEPATAEPDTLASFLVTRERYVTTGPLGTRLVGSVGHPPWTLQPADVTVRDDTLLDAAAVTPTDGQPLVHYSPGLDMTIGPLEPT